MDMKQNGFTTILLLSSLLFVSPIFCNELFKFTGKKVFVNDGSTYDTREIENTIWSILNIQKAITKHINAGTQIDPKELIDKLGNLGCESLTVLPRIKRCRLQWSDTKIDPLGGFLIDRSSLQIQINLPKYERVAMNKLINRPEIGSYINNPKGIKLAPNEIWSTDPLDWGKPEFHKVIRRVFPWLL